MNRYEFVGNDQKEQPPVVKNLVDYDVITVVLDDNQARSGLSTGGLGYSSAKAGTRDLNYNFVYYGK